MCHHLVKPCAWVSLCSMPSLACTVSKRISSVDEPPGSTLRINSPGIALVEALLEHPCCQAKPCCQV